MNKEPVGVNKLSLESQMLFKDEPIMHYRIAYPQFIQAENQDTLNEINLRYETSANARKRKYDNEFYWEAVSLYKDFTKNQFPFHAYDAVSTYDIALNQGNLVSLYLDHYIYSGGAHGITERCSDTWDIKSGHQLPLSLFFKNPVGYRERLIKEINDQIASQISSGNDKYFDDYQNLVSESFDPKNYYLTPEGIKIYFQQYEIAPYASGIPEFLIPYEFFKT